MKTETYDKHTPVKNMPEHVEKPEPTGAGSLVRTAHMTVPYDCAQLQYTIQHRTVLTIFLLNSLSTLTPS